MSQYEYLPELERRAEMLEQYRADNARLRALLERAVKYVIGASTDRCDFWGDDQAQDAHAIAKEIEEALK